MQSLPSIKQLWLGSAFVWQIVKTILFHVTSLNQWVGSPLLLTKKLFVPLNWPPTPCANHPNFVVAHKFHSWYFAFFSKWQYSKISPVLPSMTALAIWQRIQSMSASIASLLLWKIATNTYSFSTFLADCLEWVLNAGALGCRNTFPCSQGSAIIPCCLFESWLPWLWYNNSICRWCNNQLGWCCGLIPLWWCHQWNPWVNIKSHPWSWLVRKTHAHGISTD